MCCWGCCFTVAASDAPPAGCCWLEGVGRWGWGEGQWLRRRGAAPCHKRSTASPQPPLPGQPEMAALTGRGPGRWPAGQSWVLSTGRRSRRPAGGWRHQRSSRQVAQGRGCRGRRSFLNRARSSQQPDMPSPCPPPGLPSPGHHSHPAGSHHRSHRRRSHRHRGHGRRHGHHRSHRRSCRGRRGGKRQGGWSKLVNSPKLRLGCRAAPQCLTYYKQAWLPWQRAGPPTSVAAPQLARSRPPAAATAEATALAAVVVELAAGGALRRGAVGAGHVDSLLAAIIGGPGGGKAGGGAACERSQRRLGWARHVARGRGGDAGPSKSPTGGRRRACGARGRCTCGGAAAQ